MAKALKCCQPKRADGLSCNRLGVPNSHVLWLEKDTGHPIDLMLLGTLSCPCKIQRIFVRWASPKSSHKTNANPRDAANNHRTWFNETPGGLRQWRGFLFKRWQRSGRSPTTIVPPALFCALPPERNSCSTVGQDHSKGDGCIYGTWWATCTESRPSHHEKAHCHWSSRAIARRAFIYEVLEAILWSP